MAVPPRSGELAVRFPTCGDADDVMLDPRRGHIDVRCGEGVIAVLQQQGSGYECPAGSPPRPERAPGCSLPSWTACSWPPGLAVTTRRW